MDERIACSRIIAQKGEEQRRAVMSTRKERWNGRPVLVKAYEGFGHCQGLDREYEKDQTAKKTDNLIETEETRKQTKNRC